MDSDIIALVPQDMHRSLEGRPEIQAILWHRLSPSVRDCPDFYKNEIGSQTVWTEIEGRLGWYAEYKYNVKWAEFLRRRDIVLAPGGIEKFLREECPELVDRYFPHVADGDLETVIREMITKWIKKGYEMPTLPDYLHDRLIKPLTGRNNNLGNV